jgi:hypothetical protein
MVIQKCSKSAPSLTHAVVYNAKTNLTMKGVHKKIILSSILILSLVAGLIWDNAFREIFFGTLCALILWRILSLIEMFRKIGKHQWFRYGKSRFDYKTLLLLLIFGGIYIFLSLIDKTKDKDLLFSVDIRLYFAGVLFIYGILNSYDYRLLLKIRGINIRDSLTLKEVTDSEIKEIAWKENMIVIYIAKESFEIPHNDLAIDSLPDLKTKLSIRFQEKMTPTI